MPLASEATTARVPEGLSSKTTQLRALKPIYEAARRKRLEAVLPALRRVVGGDADGRKGDADASRTTVCIGLSIRVCNSVAAIEKRVDHVANTGFDLQRNINVLHNDFLLALLDNVLEDPRKTVGERGMNDRFRVERRKGVTTRRARARANSEHLMSGCNARRRLCPLCKQQKDRLPSYLVNYHKTDLQMASASHLTHSHNF